MENTISRPWPFPPMAMTRVPPASSSAARRNISAMLARIRKIPRSSRRCRKTCDFMDAPERGALMLVRFFAVSLMAIALVNLALYWVVTEHNHTQITLFSCVLKSIPAVIGIILLIKAKAVAEWISNKFDE
jgi:hypothetical protein